MDNVFQRFEINNASVSVDTITHIHRVFHEILASLEKDKDSNDNSGLREKRDKIRAQWLREYDLPADIHAMLDETESLLFDNALNPETGDVRALAATYERLIKMASEVKKFLDDRLNRVANPGGRREVIGTKAEAKMLRSTAQSLAIVYSTLRMMDDSLPELPNLTWENVPPGRDVELTSTPYIGGVMRYSIDEKNWMDKVEFIDLLNHTTKSNFTRHEFDKMLEDSSLPLRGDWSNTVNGMTFHQRRFPTN